MKDARKISAELDRAGAVIDGFRNSAQRGQTIDLSGLDRNVEQLCDAIAGLSPDERGPLKPRLLDLIDRLNHLVSTLDAQQNEVTEQIRGVTARQRAMTAYGKGTGTTAPPGRGDKK